MDAGDLIVELAAIAVADFSRRGYALTEAFKPLMAASAYVQMIAALHPHDATTDKLGPEEKFHYDGVTLAMLAGACANQQYDKIFEQGREKQQQIAARILSAAEMALLPVQRARLKAQVDSLLHLKHGAMPQYHAMADAMEASSPSGADEVAAVGAVPEAQAPVPEAPTPVPEPEPADKIVLPGNKSLH